MKSKIVSYFIVLLPFLGVCVSPIPRVDLSVFCLFFICMYLFTTKIQLSLKKNMFTVFLLYLLITTFVNLSFFEGNSIYEYPNSYLIILRLFKVLFVLIVFFNFDFLRYYDISLALKAMRNIIWLNLCFLLIQVLFFIFYNVKILNPLIYIVNNDLYINSTMQMGEFLRPSGFFLEPSFFVHYCYIYFCYLLFKKEVDRKERFDSIFLPLGLLLTGSGLGLLVFIAFSSIFCFKITHKNVMKTFLLLIVLLLIFFALYRLPFIQMILERISSSAVSYGGNAFWGRVAAGYDYYLQLPLINQIFGCGFGNVPMNCYFNGLSYILTTIGIFGLFFFISIISLYFYKAKRWSRACIVCYILFLIGSQDFTAFSIVTLIANIENKKS